MTGLRSPQTTIHTGHLRHTLSLFLFDIDRLCPVDEILGFNFCCFLPVSTNVLRSELDTNLHKLAVQPTAFLHTNEYFIDNQRLTHKWPISKLPIFLRI